ncbi:MAG TPA: hypothetical protein VGN07_23800 [Steroidobacteraceae bacterium]|jgi:hypothetical protein
MYHRFDNPNVFLNVNLQRARDEATARDARFNRWVANIRASSPRTRLRNLLTQIRDTQRRIDDLARNSRESDPIATDEAAITNTLSRPSNARPLKAVQFTRADGTAVIAYGIDPRSNGRR